MPQIPADYACTQHRNCWAYMYNWFVELVHSAFAQTD